MTIKKNLGIEKLNNEREQEQNFIDPIHSNIDSKFGASIFGKAKNK